MPDLGRPPSEVFLCRNEEKRRFVAYSRVYSAEKLRKTLFFDKKADQRASVTFTNEESESYPRCCITRVSRLAELYISPSVTDDDKRKIATRVPSPRDTLPHRPFLNHVGPEYRKNRAPAPPRSADGIMLRIPCAPDIFRPVRAKS